MNYEASYKKADESLKKAKKAQVVAMKGDKN